MSLLKRIPGVGGEIQTFTLRTAQQIAMRVDEPLTIDRLLGEAAVEDYPEWLYIEEGPVPIAEPAPEGEGN